MTPTPTPTLRRHPVLWAGLFYCLLTCVMTWPQVARIQDGLPADVDGSLFEDPFLNSWILAWGARAIVKSPCHLFDTNAFWPRTNTLAYSDHMLGYLPLSAALFWLTGNAVLVHNALLLATFVASGLGMFLLVRHVTGAAGPALLAGIVYAFCPFRFGQYGHVQVLSAQWMPLALWCLHLFHERVDRSGRFAMGPYVAFVLLGGIQSLCSSYYSMFFPVLVGCVGIAVGLWGGPRRLRKAVWTLAGPVLWTAVALPALWPYVRLKQHMGFRRDLHQNVQYSARPSSFLAASAGNRLYGRLTAPFAKPEAIGFPGAMAACLALWAAVRLLRAKAWRPEAEPAARMGWIYLAAGAAMALLALGPLVRIGRSLALPGPYMLLYHFVPGFDGLRAPGRFLMPAMLCLSVLVGLGASQVCSLLAAPRQRHWAIGLLAAIALAELAAFPLRLPRVPVGDRVPKVYRWLARQQPVKRIVELPLDLGLNDVQRMYYSTYHWHSIVNGKSGYFPPESTAKFLSYVVPRPALLHLMAEMQIDYVVVHDDLMPGLSRAYEDVPYCHREASFGDTHVFRLDREGLGWPPPPVNVEDLIPVPRDRWRVLANANAAEAGLVRDRDAATRWMTPGDQREGTVFGLALDRPRPVRLLRIGFGLHARELPQYMVARVSEDGMVWREPFGQGNWPDMVVGIYRSALRSPRNPVCDIYIPRGSWRAIELRLVKSAHAAWAMAEIEIFQEREERQ